MYKKKSYVGSCRIHLNVYSKFSFPPIISICIIKYIKLRQKLCVGGDCKNKSK